MSPFIWGYVIFVVLVILGLNMLFRRGKASKNVTADDTPNRSRGRSRSSRRRQTDASDETLHEPIVNEAAELDETVKESAAPADEAVINESSVHSDEIEAPLVSKAATETNEEVEPSTERTSLEKEAVESYSLTNIEQKGVTETTEASEESTKSKKRRKNTKRSEIIDPRSVHPISIVAVLILGAFTAILNQTLLNVALPKIQTDLNVSYNTVQWLSTGYMLVNGVLIPITAFLLETFTTRVLFIFAMSSFGVGTISVRFRQPSQSFSLDDWFRELEPGSSCRS